jgi:murein DD-endopeptidase MepM/ murein hydrolase activator NlpD
VADNTPGVMNRLQALGNHVVLDHGNGEFSFLCHFKKGSVAVKTGQKVKAGEPLGQCGNSGNSSEPHLHYHLQTTAVPFHGAGLPAQFLRYRANGETVERGEPTQGQNVEALDPLPASPGGKPARQSASKGGQ